MYRLLTILMITTSAAHAQMADSIYGILRNQEGLPIAHAVIYDSSHTHVTYSSESGRFSLSVSEMPTQIIIQHISYLADTLAILKYGHLGEICLPSRTLDEVVVGTYSNFQSRRPGKSSINRQIIKYLPSVGGEIDFVYALSLFPGVSFGEEVSKGISIRGGSLDQTTTFIEGIRSSNTGHLFNLFSVVNASAVESVDLFKGGIDGRYGNLLSGAIDISLREPSRRHIEFDFGLVNTKLTYANRYGKEKPLGLLLSARSSYIDLFRDREKDRIQNDFEQIGIVDGKDNVFFGYTFYDLLGVATFCPDPNWKIKAFGLHAYDRNIYTFNEIDIDHLNHDLFNNTVGLILTNTISTTNQIKLSIGRNQHKIRRQERNIDYSQDQLLEEQKLYHEYGYTNFSARLNYHHIKEQIEYDIGVVGHYREYSPGTGYIEVTSHDPILREQSTLNDSSENPSFGTGLISLYGNLDLPLGEKWDIHTSTRLNQFLTTPKNHYSVEPRVEIIYQPTPSWELNGSIDYLYQYDHGLLLNEVGLDNLIYIPTFDDIRPASSLNWSIGTRYALANYKLQFSHTYFHKTQSNLQELALSTQDDIISTELADLLATNGSGKSYGIENQITYQQEPLVINLSYTYNRSSRRFAQLNQGVSFPFNYDKPHEASLSTVWTISPRTSASLNWAWSQGARYSLPSGESNSIFGLEQARVLLYHAHRNGAQLPDYHRLDLSLTHEVFWLNNWQTILTLNIINAYNQTNVNFNQTLNTPRQPITIYSNAFVPIVPSINIKIIRL